MRDSLPMTEQMGVAGFIRGRELASRSYLGHSVHGGDVVVSVETQVLGHTFLNSLDNPNPALTGASPRLHPPHNSGESVYESIIAMREEVTTEVSQNSLSMVKTWIRPRQKLLLTAAAILALSAVALLGLVSCGSLGQSSPVRQPALAVVSPSPVSSPRNVADANSFFETVLSESDVSDQSARLKAALTWKSGDVSMAREMSRVGEAALYAVCIIADDARPRCQMVTTEAIAGQVSIREIVQPAAHAAG